MEKKIIISSDAGIHARPASVFVKEAVNLDADVLIIKDGKEFNGKSIMSILSMGATKGTELILRVNGDNAETYLDKLATILLETA